MSYAHTLSSNKGSTIGLTKNTNSLWLSKDKRPQFTRCLTEPYSVSENSRCVLEDASVCSNNSLSKRTSLMESSCTEKVQESLGDSKKIQSSLGLSLDCTEEHLTTSIFLDKLEDRFRKLSATEVKNTTTTTTLAPTLTSDPTQNSLSDKNGRVPSTTKAPGIPSFWSLMKPTGNPGDTGLLTDIAIKTCEEASEFELLSVEELEKVKETIREVQQKIASLSDEYIREKQIREGMLSMISMFAFNATGMSNATKEFELTDARLELTSTEILTLTKRLARFQEKLWKHTAAAILLRVNQLESQLSGKSESGQQGSTKLLLDALEAHVLLLEKSLEILKIEYLESQSELDKAWNMTEKTELENREMKLQLRKIEEALTEITREQDREHINRWSALLKGENVIDDTDSGMISSGETSPTDSEYSFDSVQLPIVAMTLPERIELIHRDQQVCTGYIHRLECDIATLKEEKTSPPLKSLKDMVFRQWVNDRKADELTEDEGFVAHTVEPTTKIVPYYQEPTLRPPSYHPGIRMSSGHNQNSRVNARMDLLIKENEFLRGMISESQERENAWMHKEITDLSGDLLASVSLLEKETAKIEKELLDYLMDSESETQDETEIDSGIESGCESACESGCESGNSSPKTPKPGPLPDYEAYFETSPALSLLKLTFDEAKLTSLPHDGNLAFLHFPLHPEGLDRDVKVLSPETWIR